MEKLSKSCSSCKDHQSLDDFYLNKKRKDGHTSQCKRCVKMRSKEIYDSLSIEERRQREAKKNRCPIKKSEKKKRWKLNNPEKVKSQNDLWRKNNPDKLREYERRSRSNPKNKPKYNLKKRFKCLMATAKKGGSSSFSKTIGCTTKQLASHLESKFKRGMTWDNYGTHWHVDHIIPVAAFDHSNSNQVTQCWHFRNLQPLQAKKNMEKGYTITKPQLSLCI